MDWRNRIIVNPDILAGKPVIKGTRLAVEFIIDLLAQGWTENDIMENYPGVTREDIASCLSYAGEVLKTEKVFAMNALRCESLLTKTFPERPLMN